MAVLRLGHNLSASTRLFLCLMKLKLPTSPSRSRMLEMQRSFEYFSRRTLLSITSLNTDHFLRQRIFKSDELGLHGRDALLKRLQAVNSAADSRIAGVDIIDLIHVAESDLELDELERLTPFISCVASNVSTFQFGASILRLFYHLNLPERAYGLYKDEKTDDLFKDNTCHKILMDLLFNNHQYDLVLDVYSTLRSFNIDCATLAFGAFYHLNTPATADACIILLKELKSKHRISQRALLYAAFLFCNQGRIQDAQNCLGHCKKSDQSLNLEFMCKACQNKIEDILSMLHDVKKRSDDSSKPFKEILYSDTMRELDNCFAKVGSEQRCNEFSSLKEQLFLNGVMSQQTLAILLNRRIVDDKLIAKKGGKRSLIT